MSNRGQAQYLRILDESSTYYRWQSYYINQTVTWQAASWSYQPFVVNGLIAGISGSDANITIDIPATNTAVDVFETALKLNRLCEISIYEFDTRLEQDAPQSGQSLIASFIGEVIGISGSFISLTISLGSSLAPVGAQVPPRKYTTYLVGTPLKL